MSSDHVFLTGTAAEIQLVKKIRSKRFSINSSILNTLKSEFQNIKKNNLKNLKFISKS